MYVSLIFSVWMRCREGRIHSGDPRGPRALGLGSGRAALGPLLSPGMLPCAAGLLSAALVAAGGSAPRPAVAPRMEPQAMHLPPAPRSTLWALGRPAPSPGCPLPAGSGEESTEPSARRCRSCSRSRYRTSASRADSSSKRTRDGEGPRGRRGRPQLDSPLDESLRLPPSRGAKLSLPLGSLTWGQTDRRTRASCKGCPAPSAKQGRRGKTQCRRWSRRKAHPMLRRGVQPPGPLPALCPGLPEAKTTRGHGNAPLPRPDLHCLSPAPRRVVNQSGNTDSHMTWHTRPAAALVQPSSAEPAPGEALPMDWEVQSCHSQLGTHPQCLYVAINHN